MAITAKARSKPSRGNFAKPRRSANPAACTIASTGPERGARGVDQLGRDAGARKIAVADFNRGTGALAFRRHRLQTLEPGRVSAPTVQHQALIPARQTPRDRGAYAGPASGDDGNSHDQLNWRPLSTEL